MHVLLHLMPLPLVRTADVERMGRAWEAADLAAEFRREVVKDLAALVRRAAVPLPAAGAGPGYAKRTANEPALQSTR